MSVHLFVSFSMFYSFHCTSLSPLQLISKYFISFDATVKEIVILISFFGKLSVSDI